MKKYIVLLSVIAIIVTGCVPKRELISSRNRVKKLQNDSTAAYSKLSDCNSHVALLEKDKVDLQNSIKDLSVSYQSNQANSNMTIDDQAKRLKTLEGLIQA